MSALRIIFFNPFFVNLCYNKQLSFQHLHHRSFIFLSKERDQSA